jgi:hypothetical protein
MRQQDWTGAIQFRFGKAFAKPSLGVLSLTIEARNLISTGRFAVRAFFPTACSPGIGFQMSFS